MLWVYYYLNIIRIIPAAVNNVNFRFVLYE